MIPREDQDSLRSLVIETISLLCKSRLHCKTEFSIDGLLGITVDNDDVFLVSFKENVKANNSIDESTIVNSGYSKKNRKRKLNSASRDADNLDSDYTLSVGSRMDSLDCSDSSNSEYEFKSILKDSTLTKKPSLGDGCVGSLDLEPGDEHPGLKHFDDVLNTGLTPSCKESNVIVIKEESLSDDDYFAAQDLNIGHDITVSSDVAYSQREWHSSYTIGEINFCSDLGRQPCEDPIKSEPQSPLTKTKQTAAKQKSHQKKQTSRSTGSLTCNASAGSHQAAMTEAAAPGGEFFSFFASQYTTQQTSEHHDDIVRLILTFPGPYVSVRNIRRKYPRHSTDLYVSSMIQMTVPRDSDNYVGELRFLPSRVKVFYKCPPNEIGIGLLGKYGLTLDGYQEAFNCMNGGGREEESPAYHRAIMEYSPYEESITLAKPIVSPISIHPDIK